MAPSDDVEPRSVGMRAGGAVSPHVEVDESGVDGAEGLVVHPQSLWYPRTKIMDQNVRLFDKPVQGRLCLRVFEVQGERFLALEGL